jgi:hypothetical protein
LANGGAELAGPASPNPAGIAACVISSLYGYKGQEPLLGKILTDRGIATEAQVRSAFEQQNEARNLLNSIIEQSARVSAPLPVISRQQFQRQSMPELDATALSFRADIPAGNPVMAPRLMP